MNDENRIINKRHNYEKKLTQESLIKKFFNQKKMEKNRLETQVLK